MRYSNLVQVYEKLESTSKRLEKTPVEDMDKILLLLQGKVFPNWDDQKLVLLQKLFLKQ